MANISGYLNNIKAAERGEDVRDSIINALEAINRDNPSIIKPLNITSNGTYAGEGGIVYNPITVNVPEGAASALTLKDINITENGETEADDGEAFRSVTVDVPQYVNEILDEITITTNGEYDALLDGYDGYGKVTVNVQQGGTGTFSVTFYAADRTTVLQKVVNVPAGGGAVYQGPNPTSSGMRFVGWTPNPLSIYADTKCYPRFENLIYSDEQILDDWVTIAKNVRTNPDYYAIGQWKLIELSYVGKSLNGSSDISYSLFLKMALTAKGVDPLEGENGYAPTTWISVGKGYGSSPEYFVDPKDGTMIGRTFPTGTQDKRYLFLYLRNIMNNEIFNYLMPKDLRPYLRNVIKYTAGLDENSVMQPSMPSIDVIWVPSDRELFGPFEGSTSPYMETYGPTYDGYFNIIDRSGAINSDENCLRYASAKPDLFTFRNASNVRYIQSRTYHYQTNRGWDACWGAVGTKSITIDGETKTGYEYIELIGSNIYMMTLLGFCL